MKKQFICCILGLGLVWGCNSSNTDSEKMAKEANKEKIDSQHSGAQSDSSEIFTKSDADFVVEAAAGGMLEVQLGRLAAAQSTKEVKDFGEMMIRDHTAAGTKLAALARSKNITLPDSVSEDGKKERDRLQQKQPEDFNRSYISMMVSDHRKDIREFQKAALGANDKDIKAFARNSLPMLYLHLDSVLSIQRKLGISDVPMQAGPYK